MNNEEQYLKERFGTRTPFKVPEGYFDSVASEIMAKLPQEEQQAQVVELRPRSRRWRSVAMIAASVCVAVFSVGMYLKGAAPQPSSQQSFAEIQSSSAAFDDVADYTMMDNQDMYAYVAEY